MKNILYFILAILLASSCRKENNSEIYNFPVTGRLYYSDTLRSIPDRIPLSNTTVYLVRDSEFKDGKFDNKWLLPAVTDSSGNFSFPYRTDEPSWLYSYAIVGNLLYSGRISVGTDSALADLVLLPDSNTGVLITAIDEDSLPLRNLKVCLFNNPSYLGSCDLAIGNATTDIKGNAFFANIPAGSYTASVKGLINNYNYNDTIRDIKVLANANTFTRRTKIIKRDTVYNLTMYLKNGSVYQSGLRVYLKNGMDADYSTADTIVTSDATGKVVFPKLKKGIYYIGLNDNVAGINYIGDSSVFLDRDTVFNLTIQSNRVNLTVRLKDSNTGSAILGIPVCLSASNIVTCSATDSTAYTNSIGDALFKNIVPNRTYYVIVDASSNGISYVLDTFVWVGNTVNNQVDFDAQRSASITIVTNYNNIPRAGIEVCISRNVLTNCLDADTSITTNAQGRAVFTKLTTGIYHVRANGIVNGINVTGQYTGSAPNQVETLNLTPTSGQLNVTVIDSSIVPHVPAGGLTLCINTNALYINRANCFGMDSKVIPGNGTVSFYNLDNAQPYYISVYDSTTVPGTLYRGYKGPLAISQNTFDTLFIKKE